MSEKPLHVQVAEALGWSAWLSKHDYWIITEPDGTRHEDGYGMPNPKFDSATGKKLPQRQWWEEYDPPRYDTDWSVTGPVVEHYGINLRHYEGEGDQEWQVTVAHAPTTYGLGPTAPVAVCNLILALHAAGKL